MLAQPFIGGPLTTHRTFKTCTISTPMRGGAIPEAGRPEESQRSVPAGRWLEWLLRSALA